MAENNNSNSTNLEAIALTAYLKPLVEKHNADQLITYEDLTQAQSAALAELRQRGPAADAVRDKLRALHQEQVAAYQKAAEDHLMMWAEEATAGDPLPVWRLVPQSVIDAAKQRVAERTTTTKLPLVETIKEDEAEEKEEEEDGEIEQDEPSEGEEENEGDSAAEAIPPDDEEQDDKDTAKPKETATKGTTTTKPKGGILAKKQAARGKHVAKKKTQQIKSPPPQTTKRTRPQRKTRAAGSK